MRWFRIRWLLPLAVVAVLDQRPLAAQCWQFDQQKVFAADGQSTDQFGVSVALLDDLLVVGAGRGDVGQVDSGSAYVFRRMGESWSEAQELHASDERTGDQFGLGVAFAAGRILVGAPFADGADWKSGAVYSFRHDGQQWVEDQKLFASDGLRTDSFGWGLAGHGDRVIVGAHNVDGAAAEEGAAYVFRHDGSAWVEEQKLTASDAAGGDRLGLGVAIHGDLAVVGAYQADDAVAGADVGATYVFRFDGSTWVESQKLFASNATPSSYFGAAVACEGSTLVVGARRGDGLWPITGSAYVFQFDGAAWSEQQHLYAPEAVSNISFGEVVAIDAGRILIGAPSSTGSKVGQGVGHVYRFNGSLWVESERLWASDPKGNAFLGHAAAISGNVAVLGANQGDGPVALSGAAYTFRLHSLGLTPDRLQVRPLGQEKFTACGGADGTPVLLAVISINGEPSYRLVAQGRFDAAGQWQVSGQVPPGLTGLFAGFQAVGDLGGGEIGLSAPWVITFL